MTAAGRRVLRASIDGFHHPAATRYARGPLSAEGYYRDAFDVAALVTELLQPLGTEGTRRFRRAVFDFRADAPVDAPLEEAPPDAILLFDGVFFLRPELRACWDFAIFVRADFSVTVRRAEHRDRALLGSAARTSPLISG